VTLPAEGDWSRLDALLARALASPPALREAAIAGLCAGDPADIAQLRMLLAFADAPRIDALARSPVLLGAFAQLPGTRRVERLGDWRLGRRLATGGMSEIFEAERAIGAIRQRGVIKLLAVAGGASSLPARFASECRILATLSDARIARYYDSGLAPDGRPWLAMEAVDGVPLDHHVRENGLKLRRRIAIFVDLLGAVAHAHRHLIVHRDLKPSNILVTRDGQLKLIDFGIAKALDETGPASTAVENRLLTLDYASPEQLQGGVVTVASDIYQLGLVLYGLTAGQHPFTDCADSRLELIRAVLERMPEAPSRQLRRLGERETAALVRGDFDAIVLKALAKNPGDRYATVDAFATDLAAWREGRPVQARQTGRAVRILKFLRRHRAAAATATTALAVAAALAVAWFAQTLRANEAARASQAVLALLEQTLHAGRYGQQPQPPETVAELLEQTERRAHETLAAQPGVLARTLLLVGSARLGRGEYRRAAMVLEDARTAAESSNDSEALITDIARLLVTALHYSGDDANALRWSDWMLARAATPAETIAVLIPRADLLHSRGDYQAAAQAATRAIDLSRAQYGRSSPYAHHLLSTVLRDMGEFDVARFHLDHALRTEREQTTARVELAVILDAMGQLHLQAGDLESAGVVLREAKSIRDRLFQPGYLSRAWVDHRLALLALAQGEHERAAKELATMVALYARDLGDRSHITASARSDLGWALLAGGHAAAAGEQFDRADAAFGAWVDGRHPRRGEALLGQAVIAHGSGQADAAADLALAALALRRRATSDDHPMLATICRMVRISGRDCSIEMAPTTTLASRLLALALAAQDRDTVSRGGDGGA
jgi:tetratricopeptide (TPR) repeat protein